MELVRLFVTMTVCTLGVGVVCGSLVCLLCCLFRRLCGRGLGHTAVIVTSVVGTPIHELGHALMCLVFGHRIERIRFWSPRAEDGRLGFVEHSYRKGSLYQSFGNLLIGVGPLLSGGMVVFLLLYGFFPTTWSGFLIASSAFADAVTMGMEGIETGEFSKILWEPIALFQSYFRLIGEMYASSGVPVWQKLLAIVLIFSVCLHVSLSPDDILGSLRAVPIYLVAVFAVSCVVWVFGSSAVSLVSGAMIRFAALTVALFAVILAFAAILVMGAFVIFLLRMLFGGRRR